MKHGETWTRIENIFNQRYANGKGEDEKADILNICNLAHNKIYEDYKLKIEQLPLLAIIFEETVRQATEYLKITNGDIGSAVQLADCLYIGITNSEHSHDTNDYDNETVGNFTPIMEHIYKKITPMDKDNDFENQQWKELVNKYTTNQIADNNGCKIIAYNVCKELKNNLNIVLPQANVVIPIFASVYDALIMYVSDKCTESDSGNYQLSFQGYFTIDATLNESGEIKFFLSPERSLKLIVKNDEYASDSYRSNYSND